MTSSPHPPSCPHRGTRAGRSAGPDPAGTPDRPDAGGPQAYGQAAGPADLDPPPLVVSTTYPAPGVAVVRAVGEIDLITVGPWSWALAEARGQLAAMTTRAREPGQVVGQGRGPRLVCDLTGVEFLGAKGLAVLDELAEHTQRLGVALRLVADTRPVRRVLEVTGLDRTLPLEPHLFAAISGPAGPAR